jgi:hypothetical protein
MVIVTRILPKSVLAGVACLCLACSDAGFLRNAQPLSESTPTEALPNMDFSEWCQEWGLRCEAPPQIPASPFSYAQLQSVYAIADTFLKGESRVAFRASDFRTQSMREAFSKFLQPSLYNQTSYKLSELGFVDFGMSGEGAMQLAFDERTYFAPSGLQWQPQKSVQISLNENSRLLFSGVQVKNPGGTQSAWLAGSQITESLYVNLEFDSLMVSSVPQWFFVREFLSGIDPVEPKEVPFQNMGVGANRMLQTLLSTEQKVILGANFLRALRNDFDVLFPKPQDPALWHSSVKKILGSLTEVRADVGLGKAQLSASLAAREKLVCKMIGAPILLEIRNSVSMRLPVQKQDNMVAMEFSGIAAKIDLPGGMDPGFELSRVEFTGEKVVIKGVPLIGQYAVDLAKQPPNQKMDFNCN